MCNLSYPPQKVLPPLTTYNKLAEADKKRAREILQSCYTPVRISIPPAIK